MAHQTSRRKAALIIAKFIKNNDEVNFYHQKQKAYLEANQIALKSEDCTKEDKAVTISNNIYKKWELDNA